MSFSINSDQGIPHSSYVTFDKNELKEFKMNIRSQFEYWGIKSNSEPSMDVEKSIGSVRNRLSLMSIDIVKPSLITPSDSERECDSEPLSNFNEISEDSAELAGSQKMEQSRDKSQSEAVEVMVAVQETANEAEPVRRPLDVLMGRFNELKAMPGNALNKTVFKETARPLLNAHSRKDLISSKSRHALRSLAKKTLKRDSASRQEIMNHLAAVKEAKRMGNEDEAVQLMKTAIEKLGNDQVYNVDDFKDSFRWNLETPGSIVLHRKAKRDILRRVDDKAFEIISDYEKGKKAEARQSLQSSLAKFTERSKSNEQCLISDEAMDLYRNLIETYLVGSEKKNILETRLTRIEQLRAGNEPDMWTVKDEIQQLLIPIKLRSAQKDNEISQAVTTLINRLYE